MAEFAEMQTDELTEMRWMDPGSPHASRQLEDDVTRLEDALRHVKRIAHDQFFCSLIRDVAENDYDIGKVQDCYEIFGGWVNRSFGIYTAKNGERQTWFFRMYLRGKNLEHLLFEHDVLRYITHSGFKLAAAPLKSRSGLTYTTRMVDTPESDGEEPYYFSIFRYIPGKQTYGWMPGLWQDGVRAATIDSIARTLAQIHSAGFGYDPKGRCGDSWSHTTEDISMNEMIRRYPQLRHEYRQQWGAEGVSTTYLDYFDSHEQFYVETCADAFIENEDDADLVKTVCHCDYHCDNLKYNGDGTVSGVYDFDSSRLDMRIFDLGEAIHNQFASWRDEENGFLDLSAIECYLKSYNAECEALGVVPPLTDAEKSHFWQALLQGTTYLDWWCTSNVNIHPDINGFEFVYYSRHFVHSIRWLYANKAAVEAMLARL